MWIRSQDRKTLTKIEGVWIAPKSGFVKRYSHGTDTIPGREYEHEEIRYEIRSKGNPLSLILGIYDTEERAIEVLDEIENRIVISKTVENSNSIQAMADTLSQSEFEDWCYGTFVYQMPEE